ncbi:hypothetical protein [Rheinheimera sp.]|uniref:hypothetical protein n=1 Tax=Rheinheimera sp. TaxID=1869214 RepID=UPI003AF9973A
MIQGFEANCRLQLQTELEQLQHTIIQSLVHGKHAAESELARQLLAKPVSNWPDLLTGNCPWCISSQLERLNAVLAALSQLELNLYGLCSDCECPIERAALLRDPASQRCDSCHNKNHR